LKKVKDNGKVALGKYSYLSLFGVNSIEALKFGIFENLIGVEMIGTEIGLETFRKIQTVL